MKQAPFSKKLDVHEIDMKIKRNGYSIKSFSAGVKFWIESLMVGFKPVAAEKEGV